MGEMRLQDLIRARNGSPRPVVTEQIARPPEAGSMRSILVAALATVLLAAVIGLVLLFRSGDPSPVLHNRAVLLQEGPEEGEGDGEAVPGDLSIDTARVKLRVTPPADPHSEEDE